MPELNERQRRFAEEYGVDRNATQAAVRAGYSPKTAYSQGQRLLKNVEVRALVDSFEEERAERTRVTADKVIRELARLAFSDMRSYVKWDETGLTIKSSDELSADDAAAVTHVKFTPGRYGETVEIKLGHKDSALRALAEHVGAVDAAVEQEMDAVMGALEEALDPDEFRKAAGAIATLGEAGGADGGKGGAT